MVCRASLQLVVTVAFALAIVVGCDSTTSSSTTGASMDDLAKASDLSRSKEIASANQPGSTDSKTALIKISSVEDLSQILLPREVDVEIMGLKTSAEIDQIQTKLTASTKRNAQWFVNYIKTEARTGEPLPYHPNFGVSEDEYRQLMGFMKNIKFVPAGTGRLRFAAHSDNSIVIHNIEGLPDFDGVVVDLKNKRVETPWGTVPLDQPIHANEQSALGAWEGFGGTFTSGSAEAGTLSHLLFDVGRLSNLPLNTMRIRAAVAENGLKTKDTETIIRFH